MLIVAADVATTTGLCFGSPGETPAFLSRRFRERRDEPDEELYGRAAAFWAGFLRDHPADQAAIEAPINPVWGMTNNQSITLTRGLYAIFAGIARAKGLRLLPVEARTWRKYFLGSAKFTRQAAKCEALRLCRALKWDPPDDNAADAGGIWLWACSQIDPRNVQRAEPLFAGAPR